MPVQVNPDRLWSKTIRDADRLTIVNDDDFPKKELLDALGIGNHPLVSSLGVSNEAEIRRRLSVTGFLLRNRALLDLFRSGSPDAALPTRGADFLKFFRPDQEHNPYWASLRSLAFLVRSDRDAPPELLACIKELMRDADTLEAEERRMADAIRDRLTAISSVEGVATFTVDPEEIPTKGEREAKKMYRFATRGRKAPKVTVFGSRAFSQELTTIGTDLPNWATEWYAIPLRPAVRAFVDLRASLRRTSALQAMAVTSLDGEAICDLERAILNQLNQKPWEYVPTNCSVTVRFWYTDKGLSIQFLCMDVDGTSERNIGSEITIEEGILSDRQKRVIEKAREDCAHALTRAVGRKRSQELVFRLERQLPGFFGEPVKVDSPNFDAAYRWFAIENAYELPEYRGLVGRLREHRTAYHAVWSRMQQVAELLAAISEKARELRAPLCIPQVVDGHTLSFDRLYPIQLLVGKDPRSIVPISGVPELNGRMVGLTGAHGGGKTETQVTVPMYLLMAQSGLPVFADSFTFNVKRVVGMVLIASRGQGSTLQQLFGKTRRVLEAFERCSGNEAVAVIDELGTGTQEGSGLEFGRDLLRELNRRGVSVVFSTQITELAQFAETELNAHCVQFDRRHRVREGIGTGDIEALRKEYGLNELMHVK